VDSLAAHLQDRYTVTLPAPTGAARLAAPASPVAGPAAARGAAVTTGGAVASLQIFRPVWVASPTLSVVNDRPVLDDTGPTLVVSATDDLASGLAGRRRRVVLVAPDRNEIARVLAEGFDPASVVVDLPPAGSALDSFTTCSTVA